MGFRSCPGGGADALQLRCESRVASRFRVASRLLREVREAPNSHQVDFKLSSSVLLHAQVPIACVQ